MNLAYPKFPLVRFIGSELIQQRTAQSQTFAHVLSPTGTHIVVIKRYPMGSGAIYGTIRHHEWDLSTIICGINLVGSI